MCTTTRKSYMAPKPNILLLPTILSPTNCIEVQILENLPLERTNQNTSPCSRARSFSPEHVRLLLNLLLQGLRLQHQQAPKTLLLLLFKEHWRQRMLRRPRIRTLYFCGGRGTNANILVGSNTSRMALCRCQESEGGRR